MPDHRVKFDFVVHFTNGGSLSARDFRLDIPGPDIADDELAAYLIRDMRLLMAGKVDIRNKEIVEEPHKRAAIDTTGLARTTIDLADGDLSGAELVAQARDQAVRVVARDGESYRISRLVGGEGPKHWPNRPQRGATSRAVGTAGMSYACLWEFQVPPAMQPEFERHYGPDGTWAQLFRRASGYLETRLLKDQSTPDRYVTVDRWRDEVSLRAFRSAFSTPYERLDQECERLTAGEHWLGAFTEVAPDDDAR
jgi:hypothetical protein